VVQTRADGGVEQLEHLAIGTRLGEGLREGGSLKPAAMDRTLAAVRTYVERLRARGITAHAIATSAMRRAKNAAGFAAHISTEIGAPLQILTGEEEAAYSFTGATAAAPHDDQRRAVLDVGGGSTECAVGTNGKIEAQCSIELGSVSLTERFPELAGAVQGEPARRAATRARTVTATALQQLASFPPVTEVRCVAGTPLTLGAVILHATVETVSGQTLTLKQIDSMIDQLLDLPLADRKALPGMLPQRADVLPAGGIIVSEALALLQTDSTKLESDDLLLGFLLSVQ
jgi:exopolyphosphatase/guanosine-5'-triphosphate,3'-diphosphate pyrophosphatase